MLIEIVLIVWFVGGEGFYIYPEPLTAVLVVVGLFVRYGLVRVRKSHGIKIGLASQQIVSTSFVTHNVD